MGFRVVAPEDFEWLTRPHEPGEPARHVAELSEMAGIAHTRANVWRYEPHAKGKRHRHKQQEETFVVLSGTLSMYVGEPPERHDVPAGGLIHIESGDAASVGEPHGRRSDRLRLRHAAGVRDGRDPRLRGLILLPHEAA